MNSGDPTSGTSKTGEAPVFQAHGKEYLLSVGSVVEVQDIIGQ